MLTYLFDASAALELYARRSERLEKVVRYIVEQRTIHREAALLIPNFCIVEVFNSLARKHFRDRALSKERYQECLQRFREDIHWGPTIYAYDLNRYHVIAADQIIPVEHLVAAESERDHLSSFDILIIAMAAELAYLRQREKVFLVTCDKRIKRIVDELRVTKAERLRELTVSSPVGELDARRWPLPEVLYLPGIRPQDVPRVAGQGHLNL